MYFIYIFLICFFTFWTRAQDFLDEPVRWCLLSKPEYEKCLALADNLKYYQNELRNTHKSLECIQRANHDECMILLDQRQADIVNLDANEIFLAGRYHSLVPIMKEIYQENRVSFYSVAVLYKGGNATDINNLHDLRNSVACFPSASSMAGWIMPISTLIERGIMEIMDCNNHVKSASKFFKSGCAVNVLTNKYNPLGDNEHTLCNSCGSEEPGIWCSSQDIFAGYVGALKCLVSKGDVAFVKHNSVMHAIENFPQDFPYTVDDFELLCLDGQKRPLTDYESCNFGEVPANALATSSAKTMEQREALQEFTKVISEKLGVKPENPRFFYLFESFPKYGQGYDLLVSDDAVRLAEVGSTLQNFQNYLSNRVLSHVNTVRSCPVAKMVFCVVSYLEYDKCLKMKTAVASQLLKPEIECMNGNSQVGCMVAIENGDADVAVFEAGDIYLAGLNYDLIPIMAEQYNLDTTHYYVVAVTPEGDPDTDIVYLKDRFTCHPGVMHGGGWVVPMAYLLNNDLIRGYGCNSIRAASEYFQKSCAPGAMSPPYNHGMYRYNLCHLCRGSLSSFCARDHTEPYYGFTGAFQCMLEGGGNVAFVKHTTTAENTDGRRKAWWARNSLMADFQLICRDGTRGDISDYEQCNFGKVRSPAVVTRGGELRDDVEIKAFINLLLYAQQLFGSDSQDDWNFKLFFSPEPYADLIFQDATQQLVPIDEEEQHYHPYLGREFLNARYRVDCTAAADSIHVSALFWISLSFVINFIF